MRYFFFTFFLFVLTQNTLASSSGGNNKDLIYFRKLKSTKPRGELLSALTTYYLNNSNATIQSKEIRLSKAFEAAQNNDEKIYFLMAQIVHCYSNNNNHKAYHFNLKLIQFLNLMDNYSKADAYLVLGNTLLRLKRYPEALNYYKRALALCKKTKNRSGLQKIYINLANYYLDKNELDKAKLFIKKAEYLALNGVNVAKEETYLNLALVSLNEKETTLAKEYLAKVKNSKGKEYLFSYVELQLGVISKIHNKEEEMLHHFNLSLKYSEKYSNLNTTSGVYQELSHYYLTKRDFEKVYEYSSKLDSVVKISAIEHQARLVKDLKFKEKINVLKLEKKYKNALLIFLSIVIILLIVVFYLYLLQKKKNFVLLKKNLESLKSFNNSDSISSEKAADKTDYTPSAQLISKIEKLLMEKDLFKDPELTIQKLAYRLNVSSATLSKSINAHYQIPFRSLINNQRIELAKYMLASEKYDKYSIEGIASSVGYKNKTTFYYNFRQATGLTPVFYRAGSKKLIEGEHKFNE